MPIVFFYARYMRAALKILFTPFIVERMRGYDVMPLLRAFASATFTPALFAATTPHRLSLPRVTSRPDNTPLITTSCRRFIFSIFFAFTPLLRHDAYATRLPLAIYIT